MSDTQKVQMTLQLPADLRKRAKLAAVQRGDSLSAIVRAALEEYIQETEDNEITPEALAAYEEWKKDPSTAQPWEEVKAELKADGLLDA